MKTAQPAKAATTSRPIAPHTQGMTVASRWASASAPSGSRSSGPIRVTPHPRRQTGLAHSP